MTAPLVKVTLCFYWLIALGAFASGQDNRSSHAKEPLPLQFHIWEDSLFNKTPREVLGIYQKGQFKPLGDPYLNTGYTKHDYWIAFRITNPDNLHTLRLILDPNDSHLFEAELFIAKGQQIQSTGRTGIFYPFAQRPLAIRELVFPIEIAPSEEITALLYVNRRNEVLTANIEVWKRTEYMLRHAIANTRIGIFLGFMAIIAITSLFLLISLREIIHLYYLLFVLVAVLYYVTDVGMGFQYLWPNSIDFNYQARSFFTALQGFLQVQFMQAFIGQNAHNSRYYRVINIFKYLSLFLAFLILLNVLIDPILPGGIIAAFLAIHMVDALALTVLILLSVLEMYQQGQKQALLYLFAIATYIGWIIIILLVRAGLIERTFLPSEYLAAGILVEAVLLAFGLSYRYMVFKKQNELLEENLLLMQKQIATQIIQAQEHERKAIAQDLHDDLGGTLATVKGILSQVRSTETIFHIGLQLLDQAHKQLRDISHFLMPPDFEKLGLAASLTNTITRMQQAHPDLQLSILISGKPVKLKNQIELSIYRILQELLHNAVKHANANYILVDLSYHTNELIIMIEDDGIGFVNDTDPNSTSGIGIKSVFSRASFINAQVTIDSGKAGSTIVLAVPYELNAEAD